jgi:protein O-mannosyl-transferase
MIEEKIIKQDDEEEEEDFSFKGLFIPLTTVKAISIVILFGLVVFSNMLFNGFVGDDTGQIISNKSIQSISNIPELFQNKLQAREVSNYYRPIPYVFYTLIYSISNTNTFLYHLTQLSIHIANTILLFLILRKFMKIEISFFLSLLFLIHPINQETVAYIANLQDVLFVFFGLFAYYLLQSKQKNLKHIIAANIFLLLSLFSKESGILFIIITVLYVFMFKKHNIKLHGIFAFSVFAIYMMVRLMSFIPFRNIELVPIMTLSFWERVIHIPAIIFYYIKTFFYPKDLAIVHSWVISKIDSYNFFIPLLIDIIFFISLILLCFFLYRKKNGRAGIFFFVWFILGLIIHVQLVPLDMTVADHYFYFPFIGLIAIFGLVVNKIKSAFISLFIIILLALSLRTIVRNTNWINQPTLISHDIKVVKDDYLMELLYSTALLQNQNYNEALPHIEKAISLYPQSWIAWSSLGVTHMGLGDYTKARQALEHSISLGKYYGAYENMALLLLNHDSPENAIKFIKHANETYPNSEKLWYYRIIASYKLKDAEDAKYAARQYFLLKQDQESYNIYLHLQQGLPINIE